MWKCFNRGAWSSASVLKVDQSNGAFIVNSLVNKDLDDLASLSNSKSKCSHCVSESLRNNSSTAQHKSHKYPTLTRKLDESVLEESTTQPCKISSLPTYYTCQHENSNPLLTAPESHDISAKVDDGCSATVHKCEKKSRGLTFYSCKSCHQAVGKCLCSAKPSLPFWLSKKLGTKSHVDIALSITSVPSTLLKNSNFKHLSSESSSPNFGLLEENKHSSLISTKLDLSLPIVVEASSPSQLSVLYRNHSVEEKKESDLPINHTHSSLAESRSHGKPSFCLLRLPFMSYNLAGFKGLTRFSACWLDKSRNEFDRDGNKNQGGDGQGESKETKEDAWRHCEIHQSLLGAISWSSALLLGWFLAQCRIWHLCGEGHSEKLKKEGERRRCIAGMIARLLFSWKHDTCLPLKDLLSELKERNQRKKENFTSADEDKIRVESCNGGSEEYFSDTALQTDGLKEEGFLNDDGVLCRRSDNVLEFSNKHSKKEISSVSKVNEKNVIPMPWHEDSQEKLPFGPITLEEAIKEAERGLEEAQAEVLLLLALEKLEEGESSSHSGPSPVELLDSAACLGSAAAAFNLGICYEMGVGGVAKDLTWAYYWYKKASDKGHAAATYNMALFHAQGLGGLRPDTNLAHQLLERASLMGQPEATDALALLTSLQPTGSHDICENDSVQATGSDVSQHNNHDNEQHWGVDNIQKDVRSNGSNACKSTINSSLKISLGWSKDTALNLDHLMESFTLPFRKLDEMEESLVDVYIDSPSKVKRRDFDYKSATLYAQQ